MRARANAKSARRPSRVAAKPAGEQGARALRVTDAGGHTWTGALPLDGDERAILVLCCSQHVIGCPSCRNTLRLGWLGSMGHDQYPCPLCSADLAPVVVAHTRSCTYFTARAGRKPPVTIDRPARERKAANG